MFQISQVEAINRMMQALDGTIVSDLSDPQSDSVLQAIRALNTVVDKLQLENQWNFNRVGPITLTANVDGEILLTDTWLYLRFHSWTQGSIWNLTVKDNKVFDTSNQTTIVEGSVEVTGTKKFTYDELSGAMQNYAIEYAKYEFVGANTHLSASRLAVYQNALRKAYMAAQKWDSEQRFGVMDITPGIRDVFRQHQGRGWWWGA